MKRMLNPMIALTLMTGMGASLAADMHAGEPKVNERHPIRPRTDCLKINQVNDWKVVDRNNIMVKAIGNKFFQISLGSQCSELDGALSIGFKGTNGRVCGDYGDAVTAGGASTGMSRFGCSIESIESVDAGAWSNAGRGEKK